MNFTREPIIETIISPKDGHKILLRNSKGSGPEYTVDAVEIVSFGSALFFRSLERPQSFLLPVTDFEISEVREARVSLKNAKPDKAIKIDTAEGSKIKKKSEEEGKKSKKRSRKRKSKEESAPAEEEEAKVQEDKAELPAKEEKPAGDKPLENPAASSALLTSLFPPPPSLISETMSRIEPQVEEEPQNKGVAPSGDVEMEEKKLDHIWTVDQQPAAESSTSANDEAPAPEKPPKRAPRKKVKKDEATVEKEIEEAPTSPSVVVEDPENPSISDN